MAEVGTSLKRLRIGNQMHSHDWLKGTEKTGVKGTEKTGVNNQIHSLKNISSSRMPAEHLLTEPFFGMGSILLCKSQQKHETLGRSSLLHTMWAQETEELQANSSENPAEFFHINKPDFCWLCSRWMQLLISRNWVTCCRRSLWRLQESPETIVGTVSYAWKMNVWETLGNGVAILQSNRESKPETGHQTITNSAAAITLN